MTRKCLLCTFENRESCFFVFVFFKIIFLILEYAIEKLCWCFPGNISSEVFGTVCGNSSLGFCVCCVPVFFIGLGSAVNGVGASLVAFSCQICQRAIVFCPYTKHTPDVFCVCTSFTYQSSHKMWNYTTQCVYVMHGFALMVAFNLVILVDFFFLGGGGGGRGRG